MDVVFLVFFEKKKNKTKIIVLCLQIALHFRKFLTGC